MIVIVLEACTAAECARMSRDDTALSRRQRRLSALSRNTTTLCWTLIVQDSYYWYIVFVEILIT